MRAKMETSAPTTLVSLFLLFLFQCDQMAKLFFQYLTIHDNENLPKSVRYSKKFANIHKNLKFLPIMITLLSLF